MTKITIDFRYVEIEHELWALAQMLEVIEPTIERLAREAESSAIESLKKNGLEDDEAERDLAMQEVAEIRDYVLPRFMRASFVVSLWACFEAGVDLVARTRAAETGSPVRLGHLRGDFFERARRYFDAWLRLPLEVDQARYERLVDLYAVGNALAHANGLREGISDDQWARLERLHDRAGVGVDSSRGVIVPTRSYVEATHNDVEACLLALVDRARTGQSSGLPCAATRGTGSAGRLTDPAR